MMRQAGVSEWRAREVLAEVSGRIVRGMGRAASNAAGRARDYAPRRTGRLVSEIDYDVQAQGNAVTGAIGVRRAGKAFYARYQEFGTRKMRAQPFLRPAVFNHPTQVIRDIVGG